MNKLRKLTLLVSELGFSSLAAYGVYRLQHNFGHFGSAALKKQKHFPKTPLDLHLIENTSWLRFNHNVNVGNTSIEIADEVTHGLYRPFGGEPCPLDLSLPQPLWDWTRYSDIVEGLDIKAIWEPARFSWALNLVRAYSVTSKESYLESFWQYFEQFFRTNPAYLGPNWASAQEVSLRAINWILILPILAQASCTTPTRLELLIKALWQHLVRIPPTIAYAKSQNNNHLLSEALGMYLIGGIFAPQSTQAGKWKLKGAKLFEGALLRQIEPDGTYTQHSSVYHRLMLHLALLYDARKRADRATLPAILCTRLATATAWMANQMDSHSGQVPNLGHNDGTLLLPPGCRDYKDYRPTVQAASIAFRGTAVLPPGPWDSLSRFLNLPAVPANEAANLSPSPAIHKVGQGIQWATLRAVQFKHRPAHADQLHVDMWWEGNNIALDAGTYSYNASPPWQNALVCTRVHNTITVDRQDQMYLAGKFLILDRVQAHILPGSDKNSVSAYHSGYKRKGVTHTRTLSVSSGVGFSVVDQIEFNNVKKLRQITLHWLLPDWQWQWQDGTLKLSNANHHIELVFAAKLKNQTIITPTQIELIRAGEVLLGNKKDEIMGWVSPTYGIKLPALSLALTWESSQSLEIHSDWSLQKDN